jgi:hypothetical protein
MELSQLMASLSYIDLGVCGDKLYYNISPLSLKFLREIILL